MKLAIFDVDGTLTRTNEVDELCFVQAFADAHDITAINVNWDEYCHPTDSGITLEIFQNRFARGPRPYELLSLQRCFANLLKERLAANSGLFAEVPGASKMLARLKRESDWQVAIATGCWRVSAQLKLEAARLPLNGLPIACAEMGFSREEILQAAMTEACAHYRHNSFDRIVSIGDAPWDVRAAKNLRLNFVGIGAGKRATSLSDSDASHILEDYQDYDLFLQHLEGARVPEQKVRPG